MTYREAKKRFNELYPWAHKIRDYYAKNSHGVVLLTLFVKTKKLRRSNIILGPVLISILIKNKQLFNRKEL